MLAFLKRCYTESNIKPMTFVYTWKKHSLGSRRRDWAQRVPGWGGTHDPLTAFGGLGTSKERPPPGSGTQGRPRHSPIARHLPQLEAEGSELPDEAATARRGARGSPAAGGPGPGRLLAGHPRSLPPEEEEEEEEPR